MEEDSEKKDVDKKNSVSNIVGHFENSIPVFRIISNKSGVDDIILKNVVKKNEQNLDLYDVSFNLDEILENPRVLDPSNENTCINGIDIKGNKYFCKFSESYDGESNIINCVGLSKSELYGTAEWGNRTIRVEFMPNGNNNIKYNIKNFMDLGVSQTKGVSLNDVTFGDIYYPFEENQILSHECLGWTLTEGSIDIIPTSFTFVNDVGYRLYPVFDLAYASIFSFWAESTDMSFRDEYDAFGGKCGHEVGFFNSPTIDFYGQKVRFLCNDAYASGSGVTQKYGPELTVGFSDVDTSKLQEHLRNPYYIKIESEEVSDLLVTVEKSQDHKFIWIKPYDSITDVVNGVMQTVYDQSPGAFKIKVTIKYK